jgi:hypothetical protein
MLATLRALLLVWFVSACAVLWAAEPGPARPRDLLIINEDNSHFFGSRPESEMTREGVEAWVDKYAGGAVTHLFLNPNSMRPSVRSGTRDAIWEPVDGVVPQGLWPRNALRLDQAGIDPYRLWIARARRHGISPWISMRMNDVHAADDPKSYLHSEFWRAHPHLRRMPEGPTTPWTNQALNYVHPEVREHQLSFLRELFERYDPDGFEIDWMRFGYHLTPGREAEEKHVLTAFMREVDALRRQWSEKRGRRILIAVRIPAHPDAAAGLGMDALAWAREGWVDWLIPCPFWSTSDLDIPVDLWRERLGADAARVLVIPGIEHNLRAWPTGKSVANDLASLRGFAAAARERGADNLYLFNWMDSQTRPVSEQEYAWLIHFGLSAKAIAGQSRRHPLTYRDTVPAGFPNGAQLPVEAKGGGVFRVRTGGTGDVTRASLVVGLAAREGVAAAVLEAAVNGRALGAPQELRDLAGLGGVQRALRFEVEPALLLAGENSVSVRQSDTHASQQIVWLELRVNER